MGEVKDVAAESPGAAARALVRRTPAAALAVRLPPDGLPYASLVLTAPDHAGRPLLFISRLAEHTRALEADPAACLLFDGTAGLDARLTGARASLVGRMARIEDAAAKERFIALHPEAAVYRDFGDFGLWRMEVERVHLVAGFGRIHWIDADDYLFDAATGDLAAAEPGIVRHMNEDHADAIALYAERLLGLPAATWRMAAIDPEGTDLRADGGTAARLVFPGVIGNSSDARKMLVDLVKLAKSGMN
ncbi:DUF2470 domain-containing protein [Zavarzinia compransoris]|uniref:HugZ family pyridoxamine 5'-phosphate oxidase n=1 Tax=Zavarzinia marina TaxID=2911065 RepID=UPI001F157A35|nr:DUF2470 domain-containing protein [Zavarzinia marina]MCF4166192.1 DUF2470 domain-containing protein [Zavarzinia marina]